MAEEGSYATGASKGDSYALAGKGYAGEGADGGYASTSVLTGYSALVGMMAMYIDQKVEELIGQALGYNLSGGMNIMDNNYAGIPEPQGKDSLVQRLQGNDYKTPDNYKTSDDNNYSSKSIDSKVNDGGSIKGIEDIANTTYSSPKEYTTSVEKAA